MKRYLLGFILLSLCFPGCQQAPAQATADQATLPPIEVFFSPKGGCTEAVVRNSPAKSTVLVQAYSFTSVPIAKALVDAYKRGVKIDVILDKCQRSEKYSSADFVIHAGIPTKIDAKHAIAHNKIMIIDDQTVITGSFNFTTAAEEHNAENLLVIRSPELAAKYTANWHVHAEHSDPYEGKTQGYSETHRAAAETPKPDAAVAGGFVASSRSQVFHRADANERRRFPRRTLSSTPHATRRFRRERGLVRSATRRGTAMGMDVYGRNPDSLLASIFVPMSGRGVRFTH